MAVPGTPDERLAYVNPAFVSDLHYYETGSAEAVPETSAPTATAADATDSDSVVAKMTSPPSPATAVAPASSLPAKPTLTSAVVAAAILEKQTSFKELSEKLSSAAVSGQPGAGSLKGKQSPKGSEDGKPVAPDGGCLAWAIVAASFMVSFLQVSTL
jgi:hypothetical protein